MRRCAHADAQAGWRLGLVLHPHSDPKPVVERLTSWARYAVIVSPVAPISGISRSAVISAAEPIALALMEGSGQPVLQVDGTIVRRMQPGEALEVRLRTRAGLVVRLDPERYQRRSEVKLSLLDLPFLPEEMRDLAPVFSDDG